MQQINGKDKAIEYLQKNHPDYIMLAENEHCEIWVLVNDYTWNNEYHVWQKSPTRDYQSTDWTHDDPDFISSHWGMTEAKHNYDVYTRYLEAMMTSRDESDVLAANSILDEMKTD